MASTSSSSSPVSASAALLRSLSVNPSFSDYGLGKSAAAGFLLGSLFTLGAVLFFLSASAIRWFGFYLLSLSAFHLLEFLLTALFHPAKLSYSSFLLNHSPEYHKAVLVSFLEFLVELFLFPSLKSCLLFILPGMLMCLGGQFIRTSAMLTAGRNFTHVVADRKAANHVLVRDGVYRLCRHPSYAGWFWWAVGTQLVLCNPICLAGYTFAVWKFFQHRIPVEEEYLFEFFEDYGEYWKKTPCGVPFVKTDDLTEKYKHWHKLGGNRRAEGEAQKDEEDEEHSDEYEEEDNTH